jgi:tetraacyldisaccharide 4'-kinase
MLQGWLERVWYSDSPPPLWLRGLERLYAPLLRRGAAPAAPLSCPIVVVGNLSVGGTGKTPLVLWLTSALRARGFNPGIVTRGYGGAARTARRVEPHDSPAEVGDEPLLLARRSGVPVAMGRERPAAARLLIAAGCNVVVSDDGLQHQALPRDCELAVIDGERLFGNGHLLPAGPLREPIARLSSLDAIVFNGRQQSLANISVPSFAMQVSGDMAHSFSAARARALADFAGRSVHAVAAIGNPERFFSLLRGQGIEVIAHPLADHAKLTRADITFADGRTVLMTEKDAVKCASFAGPEHWWVPVQARVAAPADGQLLDIVLRALERRRQPQ